MRTPKHIAIIMDGNGRWAKYQGLPRMEGHRAGSEVAIQVIKHCVARKIQQLTLYTLSMENWKRPKEELDALMKLLKFALLENRKLLLENNMQFSMIGRRDGLPDEVQKIADENVRLTEKNTGTRLCLAINYAGRAEIVDAVQKIATTAIREQWSSDDVKTRITEEYVEKSLYTAGMSDPDLLIRTAGEMRLSNFLLWQLHYSEMWVTPVCWPDFTTKLLDEAMAEFTERHRTFGGLDTI